MTMSIMDTKPSRRFSPSNAVMLGFIKTPSKLPRQEEIKCLVERFTTDQRHFPIVINFRGQQFRVEFALRYSALDNEVRN